MESLLDEEIHTMLVSHYLDIVRQNRTKMLGNHCGYCQRYI